jgi:hypothetical protein
MKKLSILFCLSFLPVHSENILVPKYVDELLKRRIETQYENRFSDTDIKFDDSTCEMQGTYEMLHSSIVLVSENSLWQGRTEFTFESILSGTRLEFPRIARQNSFAEVDDQKDKRGWNSKKNWIFGISFAGLLSGFVYLLTRPTNAQSTSNQEHVISSAEPVSTEQSPNKGRTTN